MTSEAEWIEEESFRIIEGFVKDIPYPEREVVKRVVHTTADPAFAELLVIGEGAVERGVEALRAGRDVITDVTMVGSGINRSLLSGLGGEVRCYIGDEDVRAYSAEKGITRARAAYRLHKGDLDGNIVAVGNAPTALSELVRLHREDGIRPALVVGVPVGFVGAAEAKEELLEAGLPSIVVRGRRGGSAVAAAITNALLALAGEMP
ncbi:MAG: precorrin isomerase [Methanobacteriota archaeon]|nr:MAG: precorrin isomerase [Euryarchaeota archaeon]